jgi:hypothetical protein
MTHFQLTLSNVTYSFRPAVVLAAGAAFVSACVILFAFVSALQTSIERGQALRELQRSGASMSVRTSASADQRANPARKLASLTP